jgi:aryl-alcohol dehydrogenase-like predicted oxidoreductase
MENLMRTIGGRSVPALGTGTWAMGGPWTFDGAAAGWGEVDDDESVAALHAAHDAGLRVVDTADAYGCGHAERVVGRAVAGYRDDVVLVTKVGLVTDGSTRTGGGSDLSPDAVRRACEASLRRLGTDRIDVYLIHPGDTTPTQAQDVVGVFEELVRQGKVLGYGTSALDPAVVAAVAAGGHAVAVEGELNVLQRDPGVPQVAESAGLALLARTPLAMGLLSGRYRRPDDLDPGDVRRQTPYWTFFAEGRMDEWLARLDDVRQVLTGGGRTLVQGALAYVWGASPAALPVPGARTVAQVREQAGALEHGPLSAEEVATVDRLVGQPV